MTTTTLAYPASHQAPSRLLPGFWGRSLNTLSLLTEVFLHRDFGERYLTVFWYLAAVFTLLFLPSVAVFLIGWLVGNWFLGILGGVVSSFWSPTWMLRSGTMLFQCYATAFVLRGLFLLVDIEYRKRSGVHLLTTSSGTPWAIWRRLPNGLGLDEDRVKRLVEPAVVCAAALVLRRYDMLLACYLGASGAALFLKGHFERRVDWNRQADLRDQMLESQRLATQVNGREPSAALPAPPSVAWIPPSEETGREALPRAETIPEGPVAAALPEPSPYQTLPEGFARLLTAPALEPEAVDGWWDDSPDEAATTTADGDEWMPVDEDEPASPQRVPAANSEPSGASAECLNRRCPKCHGALRIPRSKVGGRGRCCHCHAVIRVTAPRPRSAKAAA